MSTHTSHLRLRDFEAPDHVCRAVSEIQEPLAARQHDARREAKLRVGADAVDIPDVAVARERRHLAAHTTITGSPHHYYRQPTPLLQPLPASVDTCMVIPYMIMACIVMAYMVMANMVMAYIVMAYGVMAYVVVAYVVMAYMVMAYIVMAYIAMAYADAVKIAHVADARERRLLYRCGLYSYGLYSYALYRYDLHSLHSYGLQSYGLHSYGLHSHGLHSYGLCSYGLYSYGLYSYGLYSYGLYSYGRDLGCLERDHPDVVDAHVGDVQPRTRRRDRADDVELRRATEPVALQPSAARIAATWQRISYGNVLVMATKPVALHSSAARIATTCRRASPHSMTPVRKACTQVREQACA